MKLKYVVVFIVALAVVVGSSFLYLYISERHAVNEISSFETCVQNGFPVTGSSSNGPARCTLPDGRFFTQSFPDGKPTTTPEILPIDIIPATTTASTTTHTNPNISVTSVSAGDTVTSPLTITGQARGSWYFEATFPVQLLDSKGKVLASVPAQAQDDWMTTNFVPFTVTLSFTNKTPQPGKLVFKKDNPSGLPQNEAQIEIPVLLPVTN